MKKTQAVKEILKNQSITSWFQPIVNISTSELLGWEAFSRGPSNSPCEDAYSLFDSAAEAGILKPFDLLCLHNAALCFEQLQLESKLFVNLTNEMLIASSGKLKEQVGALIADIKVPPSKIVLEINERNAQQNYEELLIAVRYFQEQGYEIALDGIDSTNTSQSLWSELKPEYVKIDRKLIQKINGSSSKQALIREIIALARSADSIIIAKGVETQAELETLKILGISSVQGYLIQRPELSPVRPNLASIQANFNDNKSEKKMSLACDLVVSREVVDSEASIEKVLKLFDEQVFLNSIAVASNDKIVGMVHRGSFLAKLSTRQRRDVLVNKPISSEMDNDVLIIDAHLRLEQVSRLVTTKARIHAEHDFVITNKGRYLGIGTAMNLLRRLTQLRSEPCHNVNQLTMLPENPPFGDCVNELLNKNYEFTMVLLDIANLKAFNDHYGYSKGDELLVLLSDLLRKHINSSTDFAGHLGGDDFMIVIRDGNWKKILSALFTEFSHKIIGFYSKEDQSQGGIRSTDHSGVDCFFDLVSLTAGVMTVTDEYFDSFQSLLTNMIKLKQRSNPLNQLRIAHQYKNNIDILSFVEGEFEIIISENINTN